MTTEEHLLVVTMFAKQMQFFRTLLEVMRSRGLLEGDDAEAFNGIVRQDLQSNLSLLQDSKNLYLMFARTLGVATVLEPQQSAQAGTPG